jgi:hypothetical protein
MSDLNDLIHTNAHRAYEQGVQREQERIIKLLDNPYFHNIQFPEIHIDCEMCKTITLIQRREK